ncbi:MAG: hypothetical protein AUJ04_09090 [Acidobacteria bacterium 13_1_40CM_3_55_6]|nr:MAG: hypothetical protein AUJ04_09090 [Acidobacteria bacterium 13_1_40CM_3_55_6]PYS65422.1 MAG: hypothetical protein DMF74_04090 [Acidobacteriota bacterium]
MKNYLAAGFFALVFAGAGFLASVAGLKSTVAADVQNVKIVNSRTPFLAKVDLDVGKGTASNFTTQDIQQIFQVPDGKQLVIEHASAEVNRSTQVDLAIYLLGPGDASTKRIYLSNSPQTPFPHKIIFSQAIRLYADPGAKVEVIGEYNVDAQRIAMRPVFCRVILSGYLEDVP